MLPSNTLALFLVGFLWLSLVVSPALRKADKCPCCNAPHGTGEHWDSLILINFDYNVGEELKFRYVFHILSP